VGRLPSILCTFAIVAGYLAPAWADRAQARALVEEGARLQAGGKPDRALELYERAMAADSDYLLAYEAAAPLWLSHGQDDLVIERFERITLRHPDYPFGWYTLAYAYRRAGRLEHAVMAYETCIDLRPDEAEPHFGLAMVHKKAGRPAEALAAFERYVALENRPARAAYVNQARAEIEALGKVVAGARAQAAAGGTEPAGAPAPTGANAPAPIRAAAPREPAGAGARKGALAAVRALMVQGRYASAAALAERTRARNARDGLALLMARAEIAASQGRYDAARTLAWAALAAAPAHVEVHALLRRLRQIEAGADP
jgi:tetratricopeptide (TPR) repeat protein